MQSLNHVCHAVWGLVCGLSGLSACLDTGPPFDSRRKKGFISVVLGAFGPGTIDVQEEGHGYFE